MNKKEKELQLQLAKEERELQIKLAQLQANIQVWLTLSISFLAVAGASIIAEWQVLVSPPTEPSWMQGSAVIVFIIIFAIFAMVAVQSIKKMDSYREQLDNLK